MQVSNKEGGKKCLQPEKQTHLGNASYSFHSPAEIAGARGVEQPERAAHGPDTRSRPPPPHRQPSAARRLAGPTGALGPTTHDATTQPWPLSFTEPFKERFQQAIMRKI